MKKFTFLSLISSLAFASAVQAQDPFQVQWTLLTDTLPTVSGNVVAAPQNVSAFLTNKRYGRSFDGGTNTGWQGKGESQAWPAGFNATVYDEYTIKPTPGNTLTVTQFQLSALGGGTSNMRLAVYYSKNGFATFDSLSTGSASGGSGATYNSNNYRATETDPIVLLNTSTTSLAGREIATFPALNITLNPTDSLVIRTIPFLTTSGNRYYPSKLVTLTGTTSSAAVPVTFASVKAFQKASGVQVDWTSATEVNVDKYIVEKSLDGRSFATATSIAAKGNSTIASNYSWFDAAAQQGNNYYRVKAVDKDGSVKYTSIMKVSLGKGAASIAVSPNPVRGNVLNLQFNNLGKGAYSINLYNAAGQRVFTSQLSHDGGSATQSLQLPSLKQGIYNLQLTGNNERLTKSVVVE